MGLFRVIDELLAANSRYSVKKMKQFLSGEEGFPADYFAQLERLLGRNCTGRGRKNMAKQIMIHIRSYRRSVSMYYASQ
ncbi:hypothetical protein PsalMR5_03516 [Piscirickettsia salmonis]|uniref:hypothetical protein n=1 Tax=Piscirickettsia salmonis TaxID=1238 RepID=UPI0012BAEA69|nr:hypothetical protein [Piscirickettsia salmonis]QGP56040.1 hypothetical protein PsalSR1_03510 [Piscirickettsia salmonis]QGP58091.1 hypothetical protein PsalBI1_00645 [Piscirickettsia salmonis]QGP65610.1 hypothetical protein PsalMR5_03516 [Piscirickettsia salmonis]